jgi:hypothetical protein
MLRACVRDRAAWPASESLDVYFHEFMADEMGTVARIHDVAGNPLPGEVRAELQRFLADHPRGKEGRVVYDMKRDFGIEPAELRQRFAFYFEAFPRLRTEA